METARRRAAGLLGALAIAMAANLALSFTGAYSAALRDALRAALPANGKAAQIVSSIAPRMMEMSQAIGAFVWLIEIGALVAVAAGLWRGWAWARIGGMVLALVGILVLGLMVVAYAVTLAEVAVPLPWWPGSRGRQRSRRRRGRCWPASACTWSHWPRWRVCRRQPPLDGS